MTGWRDELAKWPLTPEMQARVDALFDDYDCEHDWDKVQSECELCGAHEWYECSKCGAEVDELPGEGVSTWDDGARTPTGRST